ncbi:MAG: hypothetical protein ACRDQF_10120, partial [Thermocrispum sp.]
MNAGDLRAMVFFGAGLGLLGWVLRYLPPRLEPLWWPWLVVAGGALVLLALVGAVKRHPLIRVGLFGAGVLSTAAWLVFGPVPTGTPGRDWWPLIGGVGAALLLGAVGFGLHRQSGTAGTVGFWSWRSRRNKGVASAWQIWRTASQTAARRKAAQLRPSVRGLS